MEAERKNDLSTVFGNNEQELHGLPAATFILPQMKSLRFNGADVMILLLVGPPRKDGRF